MQLFLDNFINKFVKIKHGLILVNFLLVFFLILLSNKGVLPMRMGDFLFFSLLYLIFALYRPGWSFLFFVGSIALENVNLAPESLGLFIRPYQIIGALTILSLLLRFFAKRLNFQFAKLKWYDFVIGIFAFAGILSSLFAVNKGMALKQSIILVSFVALYWLVRNYIQSLNDLRRIVPFFLSSSVIVVFYGIWQNIRFLHGANSFEIMPGRPNSVFMEPDWLGIFLVLLIAVIYLIIYYFEKDEDFTERLKIKKLKSYLLYIYLIFVYALLTITVSRSAWLGAAFITLVIFKGVFTNFSFNYHNWRGKELLKHFLLVSGSIILSLGIVYILHLTNFQLFNRVQSTGSGLQKITVACSVTNCGPMTNCMGKDLEQSDVIKDDSELEQYNCRHINLEDIKKEKEAGYVIKEVYRTDPNVSVRKEIYQKSIEQIKQHPIFGIGWGNISSILGKDENGNGLNSSNIFLEVWLGSGIMGMLAFLAIWVWIFIKSVVYIVKEDFESKIIGTLIMLGFFALLIPNLFNAGVYLAILWVYFGIALSLNYKKS